MIKEIAVTEDEESQDDGENHDSEGALINLHDNYSVRKPMNYGR
jgi:hypothetical protein